ncbi:hypothetical protein [Foetidibacter luteolus]|uniref:hypothetical protein n=1 Tax=Foetidibacter luteolus TaxID=2608880 RepID=UPI00129B41DD|nr:hypothetical protein [Foetidibacter luteolus]
MRNILPLLLFAFSCCTTAHVNTTSKIPVDEPFQKIFTLFVKGNFDLHRFNEDAWHMFIKSYLLEADNLDERKQVEGMLSGRLSAYGTAYKSSDIEGIEKMSYKDFMKMVTELKIDAILLVDLSKYTYNERYVYSRNSTTSVRIPDALFKYYLIKPESKEPVWSALSEIKNKSIYSGKAALKRKMADELTSSLEQAGYIKPISQY